MLLSFTAIVVYWTPAENVPDYHPHRISQSGLGAKNSFEAGSCRGNKSQSLLLLNKISHMRTLRGHKTPVYCVVWDRTGTRFATGSDDRLVKIWSAETGLLLKTCRGHDAEITDFAVSVCNGFVASSSNDCTIRVWHLTGPQTGHPQVSALRIPIND